MDPEATTRIMVRLPAGMHERIMRSAERDGESMNQWIVGMLSGSLEVVEDMQSEEGNVQADAGLEAVRQ